MTLPTEHLMGRWFLRLLILNSKVWWTQKDEKEKKESWKFVGPCGELNHGHLHEHCYWIKKITTKFLIKSSNFTNSSLLHIEMINIGQKSLSVKIGPYFKPVIKYQTKLVEAEAKLDFDDSHGCEGSLGTLGWPMLWRITTIY